MEMSGLHHATTALPSGTVHSAYCIGGWVTPVMGKRKIICSCLRFIHGSNDKNTKGIMEETGK